MDEISAQTGLSKGSVFNIINVWKQSIGGTHIEEIRAFITLLKKSGMTIQDCAVGFRISNMLETLGIKDDFKQQTHSLYEGDNDENCSKEFVDYLGNNHNTDKKPSNSIGNQVLDFLGKIYLNCKKHEIQPAIIVNWVQDLFECYSILTKESPVNYDKDIDNLQKNKNAFSSSAHWKEDVSSNDHFDENNIDYSFERTFNNVSKNFSMEREGKGIIIDNDVSKSKKRIPSDVPFVSQISNHIKEIKEEIIRIQHLKKAIHSDILEIKRQQNIAQSNLDNTIEKEKMIIRFFDWYNNLKEELQKKHNMEIEVEFELFVRAINDFKEYGHSLSLLIKEYKDFESLRQQVDLTRKDIKLNQQIVQDLLKEISNLECQVYNYKQTISNYQGLVHLGFGLKELKQLRGLITEISAANSIDPSDAVTRFFKEIEKNYDTKLGLESKIKEMHDEYEYLKNKVDENQRYLSIQNPVAPNLVFLYSQGLTNDDITGITNLVLSLNNSYLLDYKSFKKNNTIYINTSNNDIIDKKEFWKLIVEKFKDLRNINSQIERLRYHRKLEEMKQSDEKEDDLI